MTSTVLTKLQENQKIAPNISCFECYSSVVINEWPHVNAGLWECTNTDCGQTETCEHLHTSLEEGDGEYVYICDDCSQESERVYDGDYDC